MLRREIATIAMDCGMDRDGIADVRLAVTEAATNAVLHAYDRREGELSVTADARDGELVVLIADTGHGIALGRDSEGLGLGLPLMASVTSRLEIRSAPGRTEIELAFPCPNAVAHLA